MFEIFKLKPLMMTVLILLLWIPVNLIGELIRERQQLSQKVHQDIADSSSGSQQLIGPFIVVETEQYREEWVAGQSIIKPFRQPQLILPSAMLANTELKTEIRSRGIYQSRLYHSQHRVDSTFQLPEALGFERQPELNPHKVPGAIALKAAHIVFLVSDIRGLNGMPELRIDQQSIEVLPGVSFEQFAGIKAKIDPAMLLQTQQLKLDLNLKLSGTAMLSLLPVADHSQWHLSADWPHPVFQGRFLPQQRDISSAGFRAHWQSSLFSNNSFTALQQCLFENKCEALVDHRFQVSLMDPTDHYVQSNRAIKYALMVFLISFAVFYLIELLEQLPIHPMQYLFVGLALVMFYLLLVSLSEIMGFVWAYALASLSCVTLVGGYTAAVLKNRTKGLLCALGLTALYALLLLILQAEDMALLAGTLLLFSVLAALMLKTRHVDWYQLR